ncbi:MAG: hypothetical protein J0L58_12225 [Burkholderiales bacterium]|nr:hypothetical protein [Burkholderiales bacterium]
MLLGLALLAGLSALALRPKHETPASTVAQSIEPSLQVQAVGDAATQVPAAEAAPSTAATAPRRPEHASSQRALLDARISDLETRYCAGSRQLLLQAEQWMPVAKLQEAVKEQLKLSFNTQMQLSEQLGQLAMQRMELQLQALGSERALALADHLAPLRLRSAGAMDRLSRQPAEPPPDDPALRLRLHQRALQTRDPLILQLAFMNACTEPECPGLKASDWHRLEPDNGLAWLKAELPVEERLDRLLAAPRSGSSWATARQLLNQASPPQLRGPADYHLEVALIGLEAAWSVGAGFSLPKACRDAAAGTPLGARCLLAADRLWDWSEQPVDRAMLLSTVTKLGPLDARWAAREHTHKALMSVEQRWGQRVMRNPLAIGCEPASPDEQWLITLRREGRMAMLERALREQGLGAEPPRERD